MTFSLRRREQAFLGSALGIPLLLAATACGPRDEVGTETLERNRQALEIGAALPLEAPVDAPALGTNVRVAWNGSVYLAVWGAPDEITDDPSVQATLLDTSGTPLTTKPILIDAGTGNWPAVAWNGASFFVVWAHIEPGTAPETPAQQYLLGRRVSATGAILDATPLELAPNATWVYGWDVAPGNDQALVVWGLYDDSTVRGARVSQEGTIVDPGGVVIGSGGAPRAAWDGSSYIVAWSVESPPSLRAARVTSDLTVLDPSGIDLGTGKADGFGLGAQDGQALLAWGVYQTTIDEGTLYDTRATRLGPALEVLDPGGFLVGAAAGPASVISTGSDFLIARKQSLDLELRVARVTAKATVTEVATSRSSFGDLAPSNTGALAVLDGRPVRAAPVALEGVQDLDQVAKNISFKANSQEQPALAVDGSGQALVAWRDDRDGVPAVYAHNLGPSGSSTDPAALLVGPDLGYHFDLARASDAYVVGWLTPDDNLGSPIAAQFLGTSTLLDVSGGQRADNVALSCIGSRCCAAWTDDIEDIRAARIEANSVLDPGGINLTNYPKPVSIHSWSVPCLPVAGQFLVVWNSGSATIDLDGAVAVAKSGTVGVPEANFNAATNGSVVLAAWTDYAGEHLYGPTHAVRLGSTGERLGPQFVVDAEVESSYRSEQPTVGWDGSAFWVIVRGRAHRIDPDGNPLDAPGGFPVEPADSGVFAPVTSTTALFVGSRRDPELRVPRVFVQTIGGAFSVAGVGGSAEPKGSAGTSGASANHTASDESFEPSGGCALRTRSRASRFPFATLFLVSVLRWSRLRRRLRAKRLALLESVAAHPAGPPRGARATAGSRGGDARYAGPRPLWL